MTSYIKANNYDTQHNSKYRLCEDSVEMINHIISKSGNRLQKSHKTKHDWVEMVILWKLCKSLKCENAYK